MSLSLPNRIKAAWSVVVKGSLFPFNKLLPEWTKGGEKVTRAFEQSTWVMRAVKKIAGPIAAVSLQFSGEKRGSDQLLSDPGLIDFWRSPAKDLTFHDFVEATVGWLKLEGEAFWLLDDSWLQPFADRRSPFIVARPDRMRHIVREGKLLGWEFRDGAGKRQLLLPEQVIQLKCWNPYDEFRGLAEYKAAADATESDYLAGKFNLNLMRNNGDRGVYVIAKGGMPTDDQQRQIITQLREKRDLALRGQFKPVFLSGDITVEDPKVQVPDANFIASRLQNRHEIFIALGVPPSMADIVASYSIGSASDRFILIEETCMPLADKIADHIEKVEKLRSGTQVFAWFNWDEHSVMQQVRRERLANIDALWTKGMPMKHISEYLMLGLPQYPGWDIGYLPFSVMPAGSPPPDLSADFAEPTQDADREEAIEEMIRALECPVHRADSDAENFQDTRPDRELAQWRTLMAKRRDTIKAYESRFNRELIKARAETLAKLQKHQPAKILAVLGRASAADFLFDLVTFKNGLLAAMRPVAAKALQTAGEQLYAELQKDDPFVYPPEAVLQFVRARENRLSEVADSVYEKVKEQVTVGLNAGESLDTLTDRVRTVFNTESRQRARTIAMTETATVYGQGRAVAMKQAGVKYKRWLTSGNPNVRPAHEAANGQTVKVDEPFNVGGEQLMHPSDPNGSPGNVINCHCVSIAVEAPAEEQA